MASKKPTDVGGDAKPTPTLNSAALGEITWLMAQSELHKEWPVASVMQWVVPALLNNQFRLYRQGDMPVGYVSWGYFSAEVETAYARDPSSLQPKDWQSGDRLWLLDWISPQGDTYAIAKDLKNKIFPNEVGRALRWKKDVDTLNIFYLHGVNALPKAQDHVNNPAVLLEP